MKVLIVTGGNVDIPFAKDYLADQKFDRVIAADSGLSHCERLSLLPTDILGDFDSLKERDLPEQFEKKGAHIRVFPKKKDDTDTQLAVKLALEWNPREIVFLGATGTRYDHTLANISLLEGLCREGIVGKIVDSHNEIMMLQGSTEKIFTKKEDLPFFSLVSWAGEVKGIDLEGFAYPLQNGTLSTSTSLGISNEITGERGILRVRSGYLLVIRSRD